MTRQLWRTDLARSARQAECPFAVLPRRGSASHLVLVVGVALSLGRLAVAAQPRMSEDIYRWLAAEPAEQLANDETSIRPGFGAIFVPAMTDGDSEPEALVMRGEQPVAVGRNGRRIVLDPGAACERGTQSSAMPAIARFSGSPPSGGFEYMAGVRARALVVPVDRFASAGR